MRTTVTARFHLDMTFDTSTKDSTLTEVRSHRREYSGGRSTSEAGKRDRRNAYPAQRNDPVEDEERRQRHRTAWKQAARRRSIFCPIAPGQPKRFVKGDRIWIAYGDDNRIQTFRIDECVHPNGKAGNGRRNQLRRPR